MIVIASRAAAGIPSPSESVWYLGPFPIRAYALSILAGMVVGAWLTQRRWVARGGDPDTVAGVLFWAVPFGIVGGRVYHVLSSPDGYFGPGGDPVQAFAIWAGGMSVWGALALGAVGAYVGARRHGVDYAAFADAIAPGVLVAQAIGRLGNWFNQEVFGAPTTLPWGLRIDPTSPTFPRGMSPDTLFHPTFLYEMLWCLAAAVVLVRLERRYRLGHGRVFLLYAFLYTLGRVWIEALRIDPAEMIGPFRLNVWTSLVVGGSALVAFVLVGRRHPRDGTLAEPEAVSTASTEAAPGPDPEALDRPRGVG